MKNFMTVEQALLASIDQLNFYPFKLPNILIIHGYLFELVVDASHENNIDRYIKVKHVQSKKYYLVELNYRSVKQIIIIKK